MSTLSYVSPLHQIGNKLFISESQVVLEGFSINSLSRDYSILVDEKGFL